MDPYDGNLLLTTSPELLLFPAVTLVSASISLLDSKIARWITFGGLAVLMIFIVVFFRSPPVNKTSYSSIGAQDMVSPADGTVLGIDEIPAEQVRRDYGGIIRTFQQHIEGKQMMRRVAIFLNLNDKHFQCMPCDSIIQGVTYKRGEFHPAGFFEKSQYNERMIMELSTMDTLTRQNYFVVLIAGIIARRVLVFPEFEEEGAIVTRGTKISVIKFGSRVDLIVPLNYRIQVHVGDPVKVGETVLATRG